VTGRKILTGPSEFLGEVKQGPQFLWDSEQGPLFLGCREIDGSCSPRIAMISVALFVLWRVPLALVMLAVFLGLT
jgi:hypothetical protein